MLLFIEDQREIIWKRTVYCIIRPKCRTALSNVLYVFFLCCNLHAANRCCASAARSKATSEMLCTSSPLLRWVRDDIY